MGTDRVRLDERHAAVRAHARVRALSDRTAGRAARRTAVVWVVLAIILVVAIPVGFLMSTSIAAGAIGALLKHDTDTRHRDSELLDTNY